jgi:hypothetical protein
MRYNTIGLVGTLVLLCGAPLVTHAQQPAKVPRIGVLLPGLRSPCRNDPFAQGLRELGYEEGHTLVIEWRCADGTPAEDRQSARDHNTPDTPVPGRRGDPIGGGGNQLSVRLSARSRRESRRPCQDLRRPRQWSRRPEASAALPLPAAAQAWRSASGHQSSLYAIVQAV